MKKKSEHKWWASWPETSGPYTKNHYGDSNQGAPEGGAAGSIRGGRQLIDESSLTLDGCN